MQIFEGALAECFKMGETPPAFWLGFFITMKGVLHMSYPESEYKDSHHVSKPFKGQLPGIMNRLSPILDSIALQHEFDWSYVGGVARDLYLNEPYNDLDIATQAPDTVMNELRRMRLFSSDSEYHSRIRPQDYFHDPNNPNLTYPIHFIPTGSPFGYAPNDFDFTINQLSLKSNGMFFASPKTWHDFNHKIIDTDWGEVSTTTLMRAIRFATKLDFRLSEKMIDLMRKRIETAPLDTMYFSAQLKKMEQDGVHIASFDYLKSFDVKEVSSFSNFEDCLAYYETPNLQEVHIEARTGPGY